MTYILGNRSKQQLAGVHPLLAAVVTRAIAHTTQDFGVYEGLRSRERQEEYVRRGVSRTRNSKHLKQSDGWGHAVDLVPYVDGQLRWEWPPIYHIAYAVQEASLHLEVPLRWGGAWDRLLGQLEATPEGLRRAVQAYCVRHPGPDFIDGPHYELA